MKLNLGSGLNPIPDYINVDKFGNPDVKHDLEVSPWPWDDSSVDEIRMNHILEHLGETTEVFFSIIKELYRVCKPGALIAIAVPHPRHDDFITDPTHVRAITARTFELFSKDLNRRWAKIGAANSPLGLFLDVDFKIKKVQYGLEKQWAEKLDKKELTPEQIDEKARALNNVVKDIQIILEVVK